MLWRWSYIDGREADDDGGVEFLRLPFSENIQHRLPSGLNMCWLFGFVSLSILPLYFHFPLSNENSALRLAWPARRRALLMVRNSKLKPTHIQLLGCRLAAAAPLLYIIYILIARQTNEFKPH
jgi:hypothetical protein